MARIIQSGNKSGAFCKVGLSGVWGIRRYVLKQLKIAGSEMDSVPDHAVSVAPAKVLIELPPGTPAGAPKASTGI